MKRDAVIENLRANRARLAALGVRRLSLFGSAAREEGRPDSDIDLAFVPGDDFSSGGFDYFAKFDRVRNELSALFDRPVDLIDELAAPPGLKSDIDRDRVIAFE